jgi:hypothetical protein
MITLGINCQLSYLATGTRATWGAATNGIHSGAAPGALTEFASVRSVTLSLPDGEADVTMRSGKGWKLTAQALTEAELEIEVPWNPTDAGFQKFLQAKLQRQSIACAALDGDKATALSQGLWADFAVMEFSREEPEDKEAVAKIKLKPTASTVAPEWVQVA